MVWMESPTNPLMLVLDIREIAKVSKSHGLTLTVDNTFASPCLQNPLKLGATVVVHSTTKYIGGHSDLVGGAVVTSSEALYEKVKFLQNATGSVPGPFDCYLALRGLRTIHLRMERHSKNAAAVAEALSKDYGTGQGGLLPLPQAVALLQDCEEADVRGRRDDGVQDQGRFQGRLQVPGVLEGLHPRREPRGRRVPRRAPLEDDPRVASARGEEEAGITDDLIRLSVGVEDTKDLVDDVKGALRAAARALGSPMRRALGESRPWARQAAYCKSRFFPRTT